MSIGFSDEELKRMDEVSSILSKAKNAHDLLTDIWLEVGPYQRKDEQISEKTRDRLRSYFDFDDSE